MSNIVRRVGKPEDIHAAWRTLAGGAQTAAETLIDVAENSLSDSARVAASTAILDRVGLQARQTLEISAIPDEFRRTDVGDIAMNQGDIIRRRLQELRASAEATAAIAGSDYANEDDTVIDAVLVEGPIQG